MIFFNTFKALSNLERRKILELLKKGPMSAGEISSKFDVTAATISHHLKVLKEADLIFERKEKNFIFYQLNLSVVEDILIWFTKLKEEDGNVERK